MLARQLWRLGKHSAIYGLGAVVSRLIGLFLLPVVTHYLSRPDLGAVDTLIALSIVLVIVLRAGISMAFFRFYFDAEDEPGRVRVVRTSFWFTRSEEHTSELQSRRDLVCRLLLEKKNQLIQAITFQPQPGPRDQVLTL